jgi:predicted ATPase
MVRRDFPGGGAFVSLAAVTDEARAPIEIARAVGADAGAPVLASIVDAIAGHDFLLVLDNVEHVLGCARFVAELLAQAPRLSVLATSRERLTIRAEHVFPVPPLQPEDAVALFTARAQALAPDFSPEEAAVAELCAHLDGLPLAIELASAWAGVLEPAELTSRLSLRLLEQGAGDAPDRQRTLAATIDWSHRLLDDDERALFASIAVFHGGCTTESAQDVCRANVRTIAGLVEKNLIAQTGDRLSMLETIREYALDLLTRESDVEALRRRHFAHFLELAERSERQLARTDQKLWFERLELEFPNLRAAQAWCLARGDGEGTARLAAAIWEFLWTHGYLAEAFEWLQPADDPALEATVRLRALAGWSAVLMEKGAYEEAERAAEARLALARELESSEGAAGALTTLAAIAQERGQLERTVELRRQAVELGRQADHGTVHRHLNNLGGALMQVGDRAGAEAAFGESLMLARERGDSLGIAHATGDLGLLAVHAGRLAEASSLLHESASLFRELGDRFALPYTVLSLAELLLALERPADSALLLGAVSAYLEASEGNVQAYATEQTERARRAARSALGTDHYDEREALGRDLTLAQAVEQWLAQSSSSLASDSSSLSSSPAGARSTP